MAKKTPPVGAKSTAKTPAKKTATIGAKATAKKEPTNNWLRPDLWAEEIELLYSIVRSTELVEETKWGGPCFTINGKNVLGIGGFKSYVGVWFHQGVFMKDPLKVLVNASEGKTKALRQWRFQSKKEINTKHLRAYIQEAIDNAKAGMEIKPEKKKALDTPVELKDAFKRDKKFHTKFTALTPGKQREYLEYVSEAKQEKTRISRVEKCIPLILEGKGLNDKYK